MGRKLKLPARRAIWQWTLLTAALASAQVLQTATLKIKSKVGVTIEINGKPVVTNAASAETQIVVSPGTYRIVVTDHGTNLPCNPQTVTIKSSGERPEVTCQ